MIKRLNRTERSELIVESVIKYYDGLIAEANANLQIYISNSVCIGEHAEVVAEIDKLLEKIASAEEKKAMLKKYTA